MLHEWVLTVKPFKKTSTIQAEGCARHSALKSAKKSVRWSIWLSVLLIIRLVGFPDIHSDICLVICVQLWIRLKHVFFFSFQANQHQNYYRPAVPEDQNFGDGDLDSISDLSVSASIQKIQKRTSVKKSGKFIYALS